MRLSPFAAAAAALALAAPAAAHAHVTVQPPTAPAGEFVRLDVRVPTERDDASTRKVDVRLPDGFAFASWEPVPGWTVKVTRKTLSKPIHTDDGDITEQVSRITWTGHGKQGRIPPGAFQDFGLSVLVPGKAGDKLAFKALQTYSDGQVVRWIGAAGSDHPAAVVAVTGASTGAQSGSGAGGAAAPAKRTPQAPRPAQAATSDDSSQTVSIIALIVGALGLAVGGFALLTRRRGDRGRAQTGSVTA